MDRCTPRHPCSPDCTRTVRSLSDLDGQRTPLSNTACDWPPHRRSPRAAHAHSGHLRLLSPLASLLKSDGVSPHNRIPARPLFPPPEPRPALARVTGEPLVALGFLSGRPRPQPRGLCSTQHGRQPLKREATQLPSFAQDPPLSLPLCKILPPQRDRTLPLPAASARLTLLSGAQPHGPPGCPSTRTVRSQPRALPRLHPGGSASALGVLHSSGSPKCHLFR